MNSSIKEKDTRSDKGVTGQDEKKGEKVHSFFRFSRLPTLNFQSGFFFWVENLTSSS